MSLTPLYYACQLRDNSGNMGNIKLLPMQITAVLKYMYRFQVQSP